MENELKKHAQTHKDNFHFLPILYENGDFHNDHFSAGAGHIQSQWPTCMRVKEIMCDRCGKVFEILND